jgi:hypothetical protein
MTKDAVHGSAVSICALWYSLNSGNVSALEYPQFCAGSAQMEAAPIQVNPTKVSETVIPSPIIA